MNAIESRALVRLTRTALLGRLVIALGAVVVAWLLAETVDAACNAEDHTQYVVGLEQVDDNDPLEPANRMYSLCADGDQRHKDVTYEIKITPPVDDDGIPLTVTATIDEAGTTADVKFSDGTTEKSGLENGDTVTLKAQDSTEGTHGTWKLRIDAENVLEGTDDVDCHDARNEYVVRPDKFTVRDEGDATNKKKDSTKSDSTPGFPANTLYVCQTPSGVATVRMDLTALPTGVDIRNLLYWKTEKKGGGAASNWSLTKGGFPSSSEASSVWTDPETGTPDREFQMRAGLDCSGNEQLDGDESRRLLHITILKLEIVEVWLAKPRILTGPLGEIWSWAESEYGIVWEWKLYVDFVPTPGYSAKHKTLISVPVYAPDITWRARLNGELVTYDGGSEEVMRSDEELTWEVTFPDGHSGVAYDTIPAAGSATAFIGGFPFNGGTREEDSHYVFVGVSACHPIILDGIGDEGTEAERDKLHSRLKNHTVELTMPKELSANIIAHGVECHDLETPVWFFHLKVVDTAVDEKSYSVSPEPEDL